MSTVFNKITVSGLCVASSVLLFAGCSSTTSTNTNTSTPTPMPTVTTSPSVTPSKGSPTASPSMSPVTAPIIVTPGQKAVTAKVGNTIVFKVADPVQTKVVSANDEIIKVTKGYTKDGATFNPGGTPLMPGVAVVTITSPSGAEEKVMVTVTN